MTIPRANDDRSEFHGPFEQLVKVAAHTVGLSAELYCKCEVQGVQLLDYVRHVAIEVAIYDDRSIGVWKTISLTILPALLTLSLRFCCSPSYS